MIIQNIFAQIIISKRNSKFSPIIDIVSIYMRIIHILFYIHKIEILVYTNTDHNLKRQYMVFVYVQPLPKTSLVHSVQLTNERKKSRRLCTSKVFRFHLEASTLHRFIGHFIHRRRDIIIIIAIDIIFILLREILESIGIFVKLKIEKLIILDIESWKIN